jgi:hypothetical protein
MKFLSTASESDFLGKTNSQEAQQDERKEIGGTEIKCSEARCTHLAVSSRASAFRL